MKLVAELTAPNIVAAIVITTVMILGACLISWHTRNWWR